MKKLIIPAVLLLMVGVGLFFGWDSIQSNMYLSKDNITKEVDKESAGYLTVPKDKDFLVFFYDLETCEKCETYIQELQKYETNKEAFPVYKVNVAKLKTNTLEESLFLDRSQPSVIHVRDAEEFYRYIGGFASDKLPNKKKEIQKF